jgi:hypothetical protein
MHTEETTSCQLVRNANRRNDKLAARRTAGIQSEGDDEMAEHTRSGARLSRREFARVAAVTAATAALPIASNAAAEPQVEEMPGSTQAAQLPPAAEAQYQAILAKYGKRLSDEQKTELKRLITQAQKTSDTLRAFPLENSNEPAMIFHIYRKA